MIAEKTIHIYDDGIGSVSLVDSMGTDITVVNSARVSFGVEKDALDKKDRKLIRYLLGTGTLRLWSTTLLLLSFVFLCSFVLSTIVIELGVITK